MVVAFEGMDGVGKSTLANLFAEKNGMKYISQKIIDELNVDPLDFKKFIKKIRNADNKRLGLIFYTFRCMFDNTANNSNVVVERTMASTYYFERNNTDKEFWDFAMTLGVVPDLTFLLYASKNIRYERIKKRDKNDPDLNNPEALEKGYDVIIDFMNKYKIPYIFIDTENLGIEEVLEKCTNLYNEYILLSTEEEKNMFLNYNNKYTEDKVEEETLLIKKGCRDEK